MKFVESRSTRFAELGRRNPVSLGPLVDRLRLEAHVECDLIDRKNLMLRRVPEGGGNSTGEGGRGGGRRSALNWSGASGPWPAAGARFRLILMTGPGLRFTTTPPSIHSIHQAPMACGSRRTSRSPSVSLDAPLTAVNCNPRHSGQRHFRANLCNDAVAWLAWRPRRLPDSHRSSGSRGTGIVGVYLLHGQKHPR
jgi:hypothetical protein